MFLGAELLAALGAAGSQNRAAGAGAHASTETVGLGTTTVVRLESALAHCKTPWKTLDLVLDNLSNLRHNPR